MPNASETWTRSAWKYAPSQFSERKKPKNQWSLMRKTAFYAELAKLTVQLKL